MTCYDSISPEQVGRAAACTREVERSLAACTHDQQDDASADAAQRAGAKPAGVNPADAKTAHAKPAAGGSSHSPTASQDPPDRRAHLAVPGQSADGGDACPTHTRGAVRSPALESVGAHPGHASGHDTTDVAGDAPARSTATPTGADAPGAPGPHDAKAADLEDGGTHIGASVPMDACATAVVPRDEADRAEDGPSCMEGTLGGTSPVRMDGVTPVEGVVEPVESGALRRTRGGKPERKRRRSGPATRGRAKAAVLLDSSDEDSDYSEEEQDENCDAGGVLGSQRMCLFSISACLRHISSVVGSAIWHLLCTGP